MSISDWFSYLFGFWGWPTTAYIIAQIVTPLASPSPWRYIAAKDLTKRSTRFPIYVDMS